MSASTPALPATPSPPSGQPLSARTAAIVVLYHPDAAPAPLAQSLLEQVARVVVVDNHPQGLAAVAQLGAAPRLHILRNANRGGLAGAYNAALQWLEQSALGDIDHIVFVDEDSEVERLGAFLADPHTQALLRKPDTAAVAPSYCDRATGLRGKHLQFAGRWRMRSLPREVQGVLPVAFVINSLSVWRLQALRQLGAYDEGLRVDHVDTEYCLRAHRAGLAVYLHGGHTFGHRIGERRSYRLLGVQLQAGGHSAARRYLIARNTTWLARHSLWREPGFSLLCALRLGYEAVGIVMAEPERGAKLAALLRGFWAGLWARRLA